MIFFEIASHDLLAFEEMHIPSQSHAVHILLCAHLQAEEEAKLASMSTDARRKYKQKQKKVPLCCKSNGVQGGKLDPFCLFIAITHTASIKSAQGCFTHAFAPDHYINVLIQHDWHCLTCSF